MVRKVFIVLFVHRYFINLCYHHLVITLWLWLWLWWMDDMICITRKPSLLVEYIETSYLEFIYTFFFHILKFISWFEVEDRVPASSLHIPSYSWSHGGRRKSYLCSFRIFHQNLGRWHPSNLCGRRLVAMIVIMRHEKEVKWEWDDRNYKIWTFWFDDLNRFRFQISRWLWPIISWFQRRWYVVDSSII